MPMSIYTKETLKAKLPSYFKHLTMEQPGTMNHVVGPITAAPATRCSYFVVRQDTRGLKFTSRRDYYVIYSTRYVACRVDWDTLHLAELSTHYSKNEAQDAVKALHQNHSAG